MVLIKEAKFTKKPKMNNDQCAQLQSARPNTTIDQPN
jgi:hypothetical protein